MAVFYVKFKSNEKLHLIKNPSFKSITILIALISLAFGATLYGSDSILFKLVYFMGAILVGVSLLDDWEECILDHSESQFWLKKTSVWQRLNINSLLDLPILHPKSNAVSFPLKGVMGVVSNNNFQTSSDGKYYRIEFLMSTGICLPISEVWKTSDRTYCESVCEIIKRFLQLDRVKQLNHDYFDEDCSSSYDSASNNTNSESDSSIEELPITHIALLNRDRLLTLSI